MALPSCDSGGRRATVPLADSKKDGTVVFNVRGRHFEVLPQLIRARGNSTLLATLLDDVSTDWAQPIFVDANPDRFSYILDWYRYGEMFLPDSCHVDALLKDARFLLLPEQLRINRDLRTTEPVRTASDLNDALHDIVLQRWPTFRAYMKYIIDETESQTTTLGAKSDEVDTDLLENMMWDCRSESSTPAGRNCPKTSIAVRKEFPLAEIVTMDETDTSLMEVQSMAPMFMDSNHVNRNWRHRWRWLDEQNVCNELRLRVLKFELEKRGFVCAVESKGGPVTRLVLRLELLLGWAL